MRSNNVSHTDNQQASRRISDEYFAGFVDGEGCFYVGFSKREDLPLGWQILTEFHLSQNSSRKNLLEAFQSRLGCGYLKPNHAKNPKDQTWVLVVKDRSDLRNKVIPFFKKHPIRSQKQQEFEVFSKVIKLVEEGKHLEKQGFSEIVNLVHNLPRIPKKRYSKEELLSF